jgi:hypothetical protein
MKEFPTIPRVHPNSRIQPRVWAPPPPKHNLDREKGSQGEAEEAGNRKLLSAITTIWTYNVWGAALLQF